MNTLTGDIWKLARPSDVIVIPTNLALDKTGRAIVGAGLAKQADERVPYFRDRMTVLVKATTRVGFVSIWRQAYVYSFATKLHWRDPSTLPVIRESCATLATVLKHWDHPSAYGRVLLPRVGTGCGGLAWADVEPVVERTLGKFDRLHVVALPDERGAR